MATTTINTRSSSTISAVPPTTVPYIPHRAWPEADLIILLRAFHEYEIHEPEDLPPPALGPYQHFKVWDNEPSFTYYDAERLFHLIREDHPDFRSSAKSSSCVYHKLINLARNLADRAVKPRILDVVAHYTTAEDFQRISSDINHTHFYAQDILAVPSKKRKYDQRTPDMGEKSDLPIIKLPRLRKVPSNISFRLLNVPVHMGKRVKSIRKLWEPSDSGSTTAEEDYFL
jgi:hypothetical protein